MNNAALKKEELTYYNGSEMFECLRSNILFECVGKEVVKVYSLTTGLPLNTNGQSFKRAKKSFEARLQRCY